MPFVAHGFSRRGLEAANTKLKKQTPCCASSWFRAHLHVDKLDPLKSEVQLLQGCSGSEPLGTCLGRAVPLLVKRLDSLQSQNGYEMRGRAGMTDLRTKMHVESLATRSLQPRNGRSPKATARGRPCRKVCQKQEDPRAGKEGLRGNNCTKGAAYGHASRDNITTTEKEHTTTRNRARKAAGGYGRLLCCRTPAFTAKQLGRPKPRVRG